MRTIKEKKEETQEDEKLKGVRIFYKKKKRWKK